MREAYLIEDKSFLGHLALFEGQFIFWTVSIEIKCYTHLRFELRAGGAFAFTAQPQASDVLPAYGFILLRHLAWVSQQPSRGPRTPDS
ncbi:hypothetical protein RI367_008691 [Sorochytrium milnesiophthora]